MNIIIKASKKFKSLDLKMVTDSLNLSRKRKLLDVRATMKLKILMCY